MENRNNRVCSLCLSVLMGHQSRPEADGEDFECLACGRYWIAADVMPRLSGSGTYVGRGTTPQERERLAWYVSDARDRNEKAVEISARTYDSILALAPRRHRDMLEAMDFALQRIGNSARDGTFDQQIPIRHSEDFCRFRTRNAAELTAVMRALQGEGYVGDINNVSLTSKGSERLRELQRVASHPRQAFVAMWFDARMRPAYSDGIKKALENCGYVAFRVDDGALDEQSIDDSILAGIRESALVVADFTGQRAGVYFEAGFAMGLGVPVVRTARGDELGKVHFDQRQYPFILWTNPEDLCAQLEIHVRARYPLSPEPAQ